MKDERKRDNCQVCLGAKGGVPGNENILEGVVVCDYCSSTVTTFLKLVDLIKNKHLNTTKKKMRANGVSNK